MSKSDKKMQKAASVLTTTFKESVEELSEEDMNALVTKSMQRLKLLKTEIEEDVKLQAAKTMIKDFSDAYGATRKYETARIDYLLGKLEEKFGIETDINEDNL